MELRKPLQKRPKQFFFPVDVVVFYFPKRLMFKMNNGWRGRGERKVFAARLSLSSRSTDALLLPCTSGTFAAYRAASAWGRIWWIYWWICLQKGRISSSFPLLTSPDRQRAWHYGKSFWAAAERNSSQEGRKRMRSATGLVQKYVAQNLDLNITVPGFPVGYVSLKIRKYWPNSMS